MMRNQAYGANKSLGYWSRTLNMANQNYNTKHLKGLAVYAILLLRPYLEGRKFTVCIEHDALKWFQNLTDSTGRLDRWTPCISEFEFKVEYREGTKTHFAKAASQLETDGIKRTILEEDITEVLALLVPHNAPQNDHQHCRLATRYCVCESCDLTAGEPQDVLAEIAVIMQEKAAHILTQKAPILEMWFKDPVADINCPGAAQTVAHPASCYSNDLDDILESGEQTYWAFQKIVTLTISGCVLYLFQNPTLPGHPRKRRMYETMQHHCYCRCMVDDIKHLYRHLGDGPRRDLKWKRSGRISSFSASGAFWFVDIDIVVLLLKTTSVNQHVVISTARLSKLTCGIAKLKSIRPKKRKFIVE